MINLLSGYAVYFGVNNQVHTAHAHYLEAVQFDKKLRFLSGGQIVQADQQDSLAPLGS